MLKDEKLAEKADVLGEQLRTSLTNLRSPYISTIRGKGLLNAIVIDHPNKEAAWQLCLLLMENGLLAKPTHGDKIRLAPPLVISNEQLEEAVDIIGHCLQQL